MQQRSDTDLISQARQGDAAATAELFSRYWRAARAAAFGVTTDMAAAEDAASEGFRKALAKLDTLEDPERFGAWLRTIVIRQARTEAMRKAKIVEPPEEMADQWPDHRERADQALERAELQALLQEAVRELPPRLRESVALVYFEGYDQAAAAEFLGVPGNTLRRRLHDGRERLRDLVERIFRGSKKMNQERERELVRLKELLDQGKTFQAMRGFMTMRPVPTSWMEEFFQKHRPPEQDLARMQSFITQYTSPSGESLDPQHPVGATIAAICAALPEFNEWQMQPQAFMNRFAPNVGRQERFRASMPPGFADGRPGNFLRRHRTPMLGQTSMAENIFSLLAESADDQAAKEMFTSMRERVRWADAMVVTWMVEGSLELRTVQDLLARLATAVLPGVEIRFSPSQMPVYRAALNMESIHAGSPIRLAAGGVTAPYEGGPEGVSSGHLQLFVENWALVRVGQ